MNSLKVCTIILVMLSLKGETAVLTAVQKQYGDEMVDEAQAVMADLLRLQDTEMARIQIPSRTKITKFQNKVKIKVDFIST